eukprot:3741175-Rhodomonas_salina.2
MDCASRIPWTARVAFRGLRECRTGTGGPQTWQGGSRRRSGPCWQCPCAQSRSGADTWSRWRACGCCCCCCVRRHARASLPLRSSL